MSKHKGPVRKDDTRRMEDEARNMEAKLQLLRKTMDETAPLKSTTEGGGRWRSATTKKPLSKGYVKEVLEAPKARKDLTRAPAVNRAGDGAPVAAGDAAVEAAGDVTGATRTAQAPARPGVGEVLRGAPTASTGAAANLQAAMQKQNREAQEVEAFLAGLKLDRYVALFMEHGFDCMEVVQEMQESHMQELGMATGHVLKLKKRLAEISPSLGPPQATQVPAVSSGATATAPFSTQRRVTFGDDEAREVPSRSEGGCENGSLLSGSYDEAAAAASFQEAVRAWREGRDVDDGRGRMPASSTSTCRGEVTKAKTGSFWASVGGEEVDLQRASTPTRPPTEPLPAEPKAIETETQKQASNEEKLCCYQCYKQFFGNFAIERRSPLPDGVSRKLCSEACADKWSMAMEAKAEALRKRNETIEHMQEMQRMMEQEGQAEFESATRRCPAATAIPSS